MAAPPPPREPPAIAFDPPSGASTALRDRLRDGMPDLRLRVLVVDDNRDAADTLGEFLRLCGAEVRVCYDGTCALAEAREFGPDAGLFDVNMPGVDGCELAQKVRAASGDQPLLLIAITGVSTEAAIRRTAGCGFNIHLTKPADPVELLTTLAEFDRWLRDRTDGADFERGGVKN